MDSDGLCREGERNLRGGTWALPGAEVGDEQLRTLKGRCSSREDEPALARARGTALGEDCGAAGNGELGAGARQSDRRATRVLTTLCRAINSTRGLSRSGDGPRELHDPYSFQRETTVRRPIRAAELISVHQDRGESGVSAETAPHQGRRTRFRGAFDGAAGARL